MLWHVSYTINIADYKQSIRVFTEWRKLFYTGIPLVLVAWLCITSLTGAFTTDPFFTVRKHTALIYLSPTFCRQETSSKWKLNACCTLTILFKGVEWGTANTGAAWWSLKCMCTPRCNRILHPLAFVWDLLVLTGCSLTVCDLWRNLHNILNVI